VVAELESRRDALVQLATDLIRFDTTAREIGDPPRDEAALQAYLGDRLASAGAQVDLFEPPAAELAGRPMIPEGIDFAGRPQLVARFPGSGGGRSLLLNGHIDVVSSEPTERWTSDPNAAEVRDGRLYGRGSCDMKGGVAAMTLAAETLARLGIRLRGDLLVATNTDEESTGAGGMALVAHGVRADAGIVPEPTGFDVWNCCRGSSLVTIEVAGQPGHAEMPQPHWREGGAVNAIDKGAKVIEAIQKLCEGWSSREDLHHPELSPTAMVATGIAGGEWASTYPARCRLDYVLAFTPAHADADGWPTPVKRELRECVDELAASDGWLAENPPRVAWSAGVTPMQIPAGAPITAAVRSVADALGLGGRVTGLDSWYDGATFTQFADTPSIAFGPSGLDGERTVAHTIDEFVQVDHLVSCAQALAVAALRFCDLTPP
jgi:acetylornithine deacetylase